MHWILLSKSNAGCFGLVILVQRKIVKTYLFLVQMKKQPAAGDFCVWKKSSKCTFFWYQIKSTKLILIPPDPTGREPGNQLHAALSERRGFLMHYKNPSPPVYFMLELQLAMFFLMEPKPLILPHKPGHDLCILQRENKCKPQNRPTFFFKSL